MATTPQNPESRQVTVTRIEKTRVTGPASVGAFIARATEEKRTGSLTIHFSQGTPGCVEWTEKLPQE